MMGSSDPSTPLFGSPPGSASKSYRPGGGVGGATSTAGRGPMFASTRDALRESRARDRRRFMGRLAVRATRPGALFLLAGLAFVLTAASWRAAAGGSASTASSAGAGGAAVVGASAVELAGDAAAEIISQAAFGSTADGTSSDGERIMIVQPSNLQKTEDGMKAAPWGGHKVVGQHEIVPKAADMRTMKAAASEQQKQQQQPVLVAEQAAQVEQQQPLEQTTEAVASTASSSTPVDSPAKGDAGVLWLLDQDGNKKVVLIPRDKGRKTKTKRQQQQPAAQKQGLMQKFGLLKKNKQQQAQQKKKAQQKRGTGSTETTGTPMQATETDAAIMATAADVAKSTDADTDVVTYYYDSIPAMTSTGPGEEPPAAAQLAVPEVVYDKFGNSVKLVDLHDGPPSLLPPPLAGEGSQGTSSDLNASNAALSSSSSTRMTASTSNGNKYSSSLTTLSAEAQGTTNQLIVVATVATIAIFGGALVARKMRTRNFLSSCIENESLEDELAYDAAHTTLGAAVGYDTFSSGDIKWRGDLEKFDV